MVRRNDDDIFQILGTEILADHRNGAQVVNWNIEEALNLGRMQIDRYDTIRPSGLKQIRNQLRGNRLARTRFAVLTRITVIRHDDCDFTRAGALAGVDRDQHFHQTIGNRRTCRLDDINGTAANCFLRLHHNFSIGKMLNRNLSHW